MVLAILPSLLSRIKVNFLLHMHVTVRYYCLMQLWSSIVLVILFLMFFLDGSMLRQTVASIYYIEKIA